MKPSENQLRYYNNYKSDSINVVMTETNNQIVFEIDMKYVFENQIEINIMNGFLVISYFVQQRNKYPFYPESALFIKKIKLPDNIENFDYRRITDGNKLQLFFPIKNTEVFNMYY